MARFDPLFGMVSFKKAARVFAITDMVLAVVFIFLHVLGAGYMYKISQVSDFELTEQYERDLSNDFHTLGEREERVFNSQRKGNGTDTARGDRVLTIDDFNKLTAEKLPTQSVLIIFGGFMMIFTIGYICLEVWLCRLLLKSAVQGDRAALKLWFWVRLAVVILLLLFAIFGIVAVSRNIIDWLIVTSCIYRFYELYVVFDFKQFESSCSTIEVVTKPRGQS